MPLARDDALILQVFAFGETSKILKILTRRHGVRSVIAKGALRPRSRYGGVLEPFTLGSATFYMKEGRELQTLSDFDLSRSGQGLGRDLIRFGAASLLVELVLRTGCEQPDSALFDQLCRALALLDSATGQDLEFVALSEAWALTAQLGFAPALTRCAQCGRDLDATETTTFDYAAGGAVCCACAPAQPGRFSAHGRRVMIALCRREPIAIRQSGPYWAAMSRFLHAHVLEGSSLHSLEFLTASLRGGDETVVSHTPLPS